MLFKASEIPDQEIVCTVSKDTKNSGLEQLEDKLFTKYCEKHYKLISSLEEIGLPEKKQQFRLVSKRAFNAVQFIEYICNQEVIEHMLIAIYSINYNAARIVVNLVNEGKIKKLDVLMSNLRNKAHREKEEIIKNDFTVNENIHLFYCSSHAKLFSCKTESNNYYTLEGSGNMSYNSRVEQYVIDNDKGLYEFTIEWMDQIKEFLKDKKELEICE